MTTLALVGAVGSPLLAAATNGNDDRGNDDPSNAVSVERNNSIKQSNDIAQYACTNDQDNDAENEDARGDQVAAAIGGDQSNTCDRVEQTADASNSAAIVDNSTNDIAAVLANVNVDDSVLAGLGL
jgi:hypothetical protein